LLGFKFSHEYFLKKKNLSLMKLSSMKFYYTKSWHYFLLRRQGIYQVQLIYLQVDLGDSGVRSYNNIITIYGYNGRFSATVNTSLDESITIFVCGLCLIFYFFLQSIKSILVRVVVKITQSACSPNVKLSFFTH